MTLPGETISTGADDNTRDPNVSPIKVMLSAAGYYIGTSYYDAEMRCDFPNTRESAIYYATQQEAQIALDNDTYPRR